MKKLTISVSNYRYHFNNSAYLADGGDLITKLLGPLFPWKCFDLKQFFFSEGGCVKDH